MLRALFRFQVFFFASFILFYGWEMIAYNRHNLLLLFFIRSISFAHSLSLSIKAYIISIKLAVVWKPSGEVFIKFIYFMEYSLRDELILTCAILMMKNDEHNRKNANILHLNIQITTISIKFHFHYTFTFACFPVFLFYIFSN